MQKKKQNKNKLQMKIRYLNNFAKQTSNISNLNTSMNNKLKTLSTTMRVRIGKCYAVESTYMIEKMHQ